MMWTSYSARHAAQLIGLPESAVELLAGDRSELAATSSPNHDDMPPSVTGTGLVSV